MEISRREAMVRQLARQILTSLPLSYAGKVSKRNECKNWCFDHDGCLGRLRGGLFLRERRVLLREGFA